MALSCYCRLFSQANKSLQHVFLQSIHTSRHTVSQNVFQKWSRDATTYFRPSQIRIRNFRSRNSVKQEQLSSNNSSPGNSTSLVKSAAFVTGVCTCSFVSAMVWNYENFRQAYKDMGSEKSSRQRHNHEKAFGFRQHVNSLWSNMGSSSKLTFGIIAANVAVWMLWKVPRFQPSMLRYFASSAVHPRVSMVLSSFSHMNILHLVVNMYVLMSFAPVTSRLFGPEQFSAFYISAGTLSAFTSILFQRYLRRPLVVSVGASGAIMGLLGVTGVSFPQAQLQIAFVSEIIPHSFSADTGIKALILFDLLGLALGWKVLDHAGHLGGMLFGILYAKYGKDLIWGKRDVVMKVWHDLRGKP